MAQFPLPVVTGIGHDKDTSVADMVAHTALKTPTAVAGWLVERMAETDGWLDCAALQLNDMTKAAMHASEVRLERLSGEVRRLSGELSRGRRCVWNISQGCCPTRRATSSRGRACGSATPRN